MYNNEIVDLNGHRAIVKEGEFPVLFAPKAKNDGMILENVARGYKASVNSTEKYQHEDGEKELLKDLKKSAPKGKMYTMFFSNADASIAFNKPNEESLNVANYLKGKMAS